MAIHEPAGAEAIPSFLDDRYRTLMRVAIDPVLIVDRQLRIVEWNPAAEAAFGYAAAEVLGADVIDLVTPERLRSTYRLGMPIVLSQPAGLPAMQGKSETVLLRKGGAEFKADLSMGVCGHGEDAVLVAIVRDLSNNEVAEAQRLASAAQGQFLANMSHELRTPLNSVLGFTQLLEMDPALSDRQRHYLRNIAGSGRHLLQLIDEILDLAEIRSGQAGLRVSEIDLGPLLESAAAAVRPALVEAGLELRISVPERVRFRSDGDRLRQVLSNLLTNAIKFSSAGGIVSLSAVLRGDRVEISVADTGIGVALSQQERIFDEFAQVDSRLTRSQTGTGLGLALSRRLARLLGGELTVSSVVGNGSQFQLTVPYEL